MDSFNPQAVISIFQDTITNHYFDMAGRVRRQTFWYFILACFIVGIIAALLSTIIRPISAVVSLALLLPTAGMGARRLQDIGRDGTLVWALIIPLAISQVVGLIISLMGPFALIGFLAFYGTIGLLLGLIEIVALIALIYFWIQPGTVGPNQFGPDPKGATAPAAV